MSAAAALSMRHAMEEKSGLAMDEAEDMEHDISTHNDTPLSDDDDEVEFGPARPHASAAPATAAAVPSNAAAAATAVSSANDTAMARTDDTSTEQSNTEAASSAPAASAAPSPAQPTLRRVKLYSLNKAGVWEDKGTGHVSYLNLRTTLQRVVVDPVSGLEVTDPTEPPEFRLLVTAETAPPAQAASALSTAAAATAAEEAAEPAVLLSHPLSYGQDYTVQGHTIITWCMSDTATDVALSFQDTVFCDEAWKVISEQLMFLNPNPVVLHQQQQELQQQQQHAREQEAAAIAQAAAAQQQQSQEHVIMGGLDDDIVCGPMQGDSLGNDDYCLTQEILSQHDAQQDEMHANARRLMEDMPDAPPVSIDALDKLANRMQSQRISKRELLEVIEIWKQKEAEFEELLDEDRVAFANEQEAARNRGMHTPPPSDAAAAAAATEVTSPHTPPPQSAAAAAASASAVRSLSAASSPVASPASAHGGGAPSSPDIDPLLHTFSQLHSIFRFVKSLLLLNDVEVFEFIFSDQHIEQLIGMLEYDPVFSEHPVRGPWSPPHTPRDFHTHRSFLGRAHFKRVIPFHDEVVEHKVHQSYKVQYLKDVILFTHLDDPTLSTFTQILFVNMMSIIQRLTDRREFITELFDTLNHFAATDPAQLEIEREKERTLERQQTQLLSRQESTSSVAAEGGSQQADAGSPRSKSNPSSQPLSSPSSSAALTQADSTGAVAAPASATSSSTAAPAATAAAAAMDSTSGVAAIAVVDAATTDSSNAAPLPSLHSLLLFLQELVLMAKSVQIPVRDAFYRVLDQNSLFEVIEAILVKEEEQEKKKQGNAAVEEEQIDAEAATPAAAAAASSSSSAVAAPAAPSFSFLSSASTVALSSSAHTNSLWLICTDIISNICIHDASLFRTYLISTFPAPHSILHMMFDIFSRRNLSMSVAHQMSCLIRLVLDPEAMSPQDQAMFLGRVYEQHLHKLLKPIKFLQPSSPTETPFENVTTAIGAPMDLIAMRERMAARQKKELRAASYHIAAYHAIELLSYCALHHSCSPQPQQPPVNFFRRFAQQHSVLPFVLNLLRTTRRNDLVCSAIRFFRICIGSKEDMATQTILQHRLFEPIFMHFQHNGNRYNLLNSVVVEIMHFLNSTTQRPRPEDRVDNYNPNSIIFLQHLIEGGYWARFNLDRIVYVKTFQQSKAIYAEWLRQEAEREREAHGSNNGGGAAAASGMRMSSVFNVSKSTHSILSDSDDEDSTVPAAAAAQAAPSSNGRSNGSKKRERERERHKDKSDDRYVNSSRSAARRQARRARLEAQTQQQQMREQQQQMLHTAPTPPHPQSFHASSYASPSAMLIDGDDEEMEDNGDMPNSGSSAAAAAAATADGEVDSPGLNYDDCSSSSSPEPTPSPEAPAVGEDEESGPSPSSTPIPRIIFVSSEEDGGVKRQVLPNSEEHPPQSQSQPPRRVLGKHKRDNGDSSALSPPSSSSAAASSSSPVLFSSPPPGLAYSPSSPSSSSSPPVQSLLHSPPPHHPGAPSSYNQLSSPSSSSSGGGKHAHSQHNPYLHVPPSELPPTAMRSPELTPLGLPSSPSSSSSNPDHAAPNSPPRQLTTLDLAEECDDFAAHEAEARSSNASTLTPTSSRSPSLGSAGGPMSPDRRNGVSAGPSAFVFSIASPPPPAAAAASSSPSSSALLHAELLPHPALKLKPAPSTLFATLSAGNAAAAAAAAGTTAVTAATAFEQEQEQASNKRRKVEQHGS